MRRECGPSRHTIIGVDIDGKRVHARVAHQGELSEKDREALEAAVRALQIYLKNRETLALLGLDITPGADL